MRIIGSESLQIFVYLKNLISCLEKQRLQLLMSTFNILIKKC